MATFYDLGLTTPLVKAIQKLGFEETTPIQEAAIPIVLQGKDLIGQAQTGTGKTAAYGVPLAEKIEKEQRQIQALVVAPTRELVIQVAEELNKIGIYKGVRALPIYGGQKIENQIKSLKSRPQIIVGTPGRLMDHMRRRTIRLQEVKMVVIDEADEMLNMGFIEDIEYILSEIPKNRQTMLFSATIPKEVLDLAQKFMIKPEMIRIKAREVTVPNIEQYHIKVQEKEKFEILCRLFDIHSPELVIVFGRTKKRVDELTEALLIRGYSVDGIHGDLTQAKRDSVLKSFRMGVINILVATDVAARGLDIGGVTHVYNFDIPQDPESYVHRIGRTGRAGNRGMAITLVTHREMGQLNLIENAIHQRIVRQKAPTLLEANLGQQEVVMEKMLKVLEEKKYHSYYKLAERLLEEGEAVAVLASALSLLAKEPSDVTVSITEETSYRPKSTGNKRGGRWQNKK